MKLPQRLSAMILAAAGALACRPTPRAAPAAPCVWSSPPRPAIAWQHGPQAGELRGRVVAVGSGAPLAHALVRLEPGDHGATSDSGGVFHLSNVPGGRYHLRVLHIGLPAAETWVTVGEEGLTVLAALPLPPGDLVACLRPAPRPPAT
jgi:hypothetical protein